MLREFRIVSQPDGSSIGRSAFVDGEEWGPSKSDNHGKRNQ